jgi:DNA-binding beta-propeller fold protein YncE
MGVVFRARDLSLDSVRALKVIPDELAGDERFRERFRREARLAAGVDHANVVTVHHAGEEEGTPYLSMSLVEGPDLGTLVEAAGPLEPGRASALISGVAAGLEAAHRAGLVHRDVKPSNVLLAGADEDERAVVMDFGISLVLTDEEGITQTGDFLGSVDYIAPEQIEGTAVDGRADVYSLGALAFYLLTGEAPFAGRSDAAKLVAHVNADRPRPSDRGATTGPAVDDAITRAMASDPAARFATPTAFAEAFAAGIAGALAQPAPRRAVGVAVVAIAAAAVTLLLLLGDPPEPVDKVVRAELAGRETATIQVGTGPTSLTTVDRVTWVAAHDAGLVQAIPAGGKRTTIEIDLGPNAEPSSVAVGFSSVWIVDDGRLVRAPLSGEGDLIEIPLAGDPKDVVVSPRSVWVALEDADSVARVDPDTNAVADELAVADGPRSVVYGAGGVWVACIDAGSVVRIDEEEARVEGRPIPAGTRPNDIAVGNEGIWVIDNLEGVVRRIDGKSLKVDEPIQVGTRPRGIVAARDSIWVSSFEEGSVTRIREMDGRQVGRPVRVGEEPADISAGAEAIWTANFGSDTVSRINPGP